MIENISPSVDDDIFEIFVAQVCEHFGWTYQQYCEAPQWLIETYKVMSTLNKEKTKQSNSVLN